MELSQYLYAFVALVFVLGLIGVLAVVARRFGLGFATPSRAGRNRRLSIVEAMNLDPKRRLVLIRRDAIEHLVLLGANSELLIEAGIGGEGANFSAALRGASGEPPLPGGTDVERP